MFDSSIAILFLNHNFTKITVDNPIILNLSLFFFLISATLFSLRKTVGDKPLSFLQTNQMKGLSILIIIIHHLSLHTLENPMDIPFFKDAGFIGVALFLLLSGLGISISLQEKGIKYFFVKRVSKVFIPFIFAMLIEVILTSLIFQNSNIVDLFLNIFTYVSHVDRNMWFIVFILFWYCTTYIAFLLNFSEKSKIFFLFFVASMLIYIPNLSSQWKWNAFSFPLGFLLGINSKYITQKATELLNRNLAILFGLILMTFLASKIAYVFPSKSKQYAFLFNPSILVFTIIAVATLIYYVMKTKMSSDITKEIMAGLLAIVFVYFNFLIQLGGANNITYNLSRQFAGILAATSIVLIVSLLVKFKVYSAFLNFIGSISFELYLLHGMFMYSFDFILFRGNIILTFYIYLIAIFLISLLFRKLNSIVHNSILNKLQLQ